MSVTLYSVIMALIWFTATVLIVNCTLHKASIYGLRIVAVTLFLFTLRIFLPLDLEWSYIIHSVRIYPFLRNVMRATIIGQISVEECLLICWIIGACIRAALLVQKLLLQRDFRRASSSRKPSEELHALFLEVSNERGYDGPVTLAVSTQASTAYQAGFVHPYIVLPYNIDLFTEVDIRNMFQHELCHFLGGDLWIKLGMQMIACTLWWNPVVHILTRNVEQMLEIRCDRRVCAQMSEMEQMSYLDTLLRLLSQDSLDIPRISMDYSGCTAEMDIVQRFQMVLQGQVRAGSKLKSGIGYLLCLALFAASYCVILQPWVASPDIDETGLEITGFDQEDSYIICGPDGTLKFYCNGTYSATIPEETINSPPFNDLPIIYEYERSNVS